MPALFCLGFTWLLALHMSASSDAPGRQASRLGPLPEHNLVVEPMPQSWDEGVPLGNGLLGALVWGDGKPLNLSVDCTRLWDLRPVPEFHSSEYSFATLQEWEKAGRYADLIRLYEEPYSRGNAPTKIPAGRIAFHFAEGVFTKETLLLLSPECIVSGQQGEVRFWVHATEPVGMVEVHGVAPQVELLAPPFAGKEGEPPASQDDLANLGYPPPRLVTAEDFAAYEQHGWDDFRFAVGIQWQAPAKRGEPWRAAWTVVTSTESQDVMGEVRERTTRALRRWKELWESHTSWWRRYWDQGTVQVPNKRIEKQWYWDMYKFGAASREGFPPITLQGPWTADNGKIPPWKGDYHHDLNTELSYWPCYSGNRLAEGKSFVDWLWDNREHCREWTQRFFGLPGIAVPMTTDLLCRQIGGWRQYTHSATTGAWLAHHFFLHWRYSMDETFLRERAYPYIKECAVFLEAITREKDGRGLRRLPLSSSPEINDNRPNAWFHVWTNYDLALTRWLFQTAQSMALELGIHEDAAQWEKVLQELPEFAVGEDGGLLVAADYPLKESHRHFSHLMAIHPLGLIDPHDSPEAARIVNASLNHLDSLGTKYWCGYSFAWLASLAARAGDGEKAERALDIFAQAFVLRNSFHCNGDQSGKGFSTFTYRPFTLEGNFAAAAGLQEMLLQSHRGYIEVFPAVPSQWTDAAFTTLRAQGAFLVSAERRNGRTERVVIRSEKGGPCRFLSPFTGKVMSFMMLAGEERTFTATDNF